MGFLRRLFGAKKPGPPSDGSCSKSDKDSNKKKWSFVKQGNRRKSLPPPPPQPTVFTQFDTSTSLERNKHAIAVAAATAAVAEAALAAAHAAAEVVRLTSNGVGGSSAVSRQKARVEQPRLPEENAVVIIQSGFRGYLARRALRALKALVKLQALVRGHIVRKQSADMLRRMQTLVKLQTQARATRSHLSSSSDNLHCFKSSLYHYPVPEEHEHPHPVYSAKFGGSSILKRCSSNATIRKNESEKPRFGPNWLDHWMQDNSCNQIKDTSSKNRHTNNQKIDKILEVDTWKPHDSPSKHSIKPQNQSVSRTADNSPQTFSASSKTGNGAKRGTTTPFTPTRSECSWSFLGGYSGYPNYMANTESSRAKVRSQSAPKQRLEFERCGSTRRPFQGLWDIGSNNSDQDSEYSRTNKVSPALSRFNRIGSSNNLR